MVKRVVLALSEITGHLHFQCFKPTVSQRATKQTWPTTC